MVTRAKGDVDARFGAAAATVSSCLTADEALELFLRRAHGTVEEKGLVVPVVVVRRSSCASVRRIVRCDSRSSSERY